MKTLGVVIFHDFDLLDVTGPLEMFSYLNDQLKCIIIAEKRTLIKSFQGVSIAVDVDFDHCPDLNYLLIPGGMGTRTEVNNINLINWINSQSPKSEMTMTVCTGSALLAKTGLLDNRNATSNKLAFDWVKKQGPRVNWINQARWVDDGNIVTSSGIAAGIDMSLYVIARLFGIETTQKIAKQTEYFWNSNCDDDPFFQL